MADIEPLVHKILQWEGGFVNDPADKGGSTNKGITIQTWKSVGYDKDGDGDVDIEDLKLIHTDDFKGILKNHFWDKWKADSIKSQSIAEILVDWVWGSGIWGIRIPQRLLGQKDDGIVTSKTIFALNVHDPRIFHGIIFQARINFIQQIIENDIIQYERKIGRKATREELMKNTNKRFEHGWMNRLYSFSF